MSAFWVLFLLGVSAMDFETWNYARPPDWNYASSVIKYIEELHKLHNFTTIVMFHKSGCTNWRKQAMLSKQIQESLKVPFISLTEHWQVQLRNYVQSEYIISLVFIETPRDEILGVVDGTLRGIHFSKVTFVSTNLTVADMEQLFRWCWKGGFVNANVMVPQDSGDYSLSTYQPFPEVSVVNVISREARDFFPEKMRDFKGYTFRSPVKQDMPRVFTHLDNNGNKIYNGIGGRIYTAFIKKFNGSFEELDIPNSTDNVEIATVFRFVRERKIDISMHPYGNFNRSAYGASYPYLLTRFCLVVPVRNAVPEYMYLIKPFKASTWGSIVCSIFYISACLFVAGVITNGKKDFGRALCSCLCGILNISMPIKSFPRSKISLLIYCQVIVLGFVLSNMYLTKLYSFLTKPFYGRQLDTLEQIYDSDLKILTLQSEVDTIEGSNNFPWKYHELLVVGDADEVASHYRALNRSFGYAMTTEQWSLYLQQQDHMQHKRLRVTNICFGQYLVAFPMQLDSPFAEPMSSFILDTAAFGLYQRWKVLNFEQAVWSDLLQRFKDGVIHAYPASLNLSNLTLLWYIYLFGMLSALSGFLLEHCRFWYSNNFCKHCFKVHIFKCNANRMPTPSDEYI